MKKSVKCEYCQGNETLFDSIRFWTGRTDSIDIDIADKNFFVMAEVDNVAHTSKFEINYCPMCGRDLNIAE